MVPVALHGRNLTGSQKNETPMVNDIYAIVVAFQKWALWISFKLVVVLKHHRSLENWVTEQKDTPSGPRGSQLSIEPDASSYSDCDAEFSVWVDVIGACERLSAAVAAAAASLAVRHPLVRRSASPCLTD